MNRRVLVVPATEVGRGGGHIARSADLVRKFRAAGVEAFLYHPLKGERGLMEIQAAAGGLEEAALCSDESGSAEWTFIVLDRYRTPTAELARWAALGPVVGLDEGGPSRSAFDYLLDLLPGPPGRTEANLADPGLLSLPGRRRPSFIEVDHPGPLRVLVAFGAEDPAGLTSPTVFSLQEVSGLAVDALLGPLEAETRSADETAMIEAGARVLHAIPDLKERLADYDLVVTSFGLTAFEAARARSCVLLVSPTRYHERLARSRGFASAGLGRGAASRVGAFLTTGPGGSVGARLKKNLELLAERTAAAAPREPDAAEGESAATLLSSFSFPGAARCPLCGERGGSGQRALARFPDRTYRRCSSCGMLHMIRPTPPPITYGRDYFFNDYKKQYGRTYLEDFPQLERAGAIRVGRIAELLSFGSAQARADSGEMKPRILDIGCAYGPFLAAARSAGFQGFGVDPAEDAVRFVREDLGIPAAVGAFPAFDPVATWGGEPFDAVALWYVIEHFADLRNVLEAASAALKPGGVLAFSTPSGSGISARARFSDFLRKSPADHWTIWEPERTAGFLARYGFKLEKIVVTGHHPERFPGLAAIRSDGITHRFALRISRSFGLGDTFEAYAVKK